MSLNIQYHNIHVWAAASNVAISVCEDAWLHDESGARVPPGPGDPGLRDRYNGQYGWHLGINFGNLHDLVNHLYADEAPNYYCNNWFLNCGTILDGTVTKLAINAHGAPGLVDVNALTSRRDPNLTLEMKAKIRAECLTLETLTNGKFQEDLMRIERKLRGDATIIFAGCMAGAYDEGKHFLIALSNFFKGREIVAFTTKGFSIGGGGMRHGSYCSEPGMRDGMMQSDSTTESLEYENYGKHLHDLNTLPWASETSRHARVALNGEIIKEASDETWIFGPP